MTRRRRVGLALVLAAVGCAAVRHPFRSHVRWRWTRSRADYIRVAQVWLGKDLASWRKQMRTLDLLNGPPDPGRFGREERVQCTYTNPSDDDAFAGNTPKFYCARGGTDTFKVKWGATNAEVYAEVAGTRLLWALGFGADAVYPVQVDCTGCADDPWEDRKEHPGHRPPTFAPAIAERKFPATTIQESRHQGWRWDELPTVDPAHGGAPREQLDAFMLLAAFIQHRDSKADNQRLVCLDDGGRKGLGKLDCQRPFMLIQDLGSAFGGPSLTATKKMDLEAWSKQPLWEDAHRCVADLTHEPDGWGGLRHPEIGEAGRQFLATLLSELDDAQVRAIFTAARADARGGVEAWVAAFKARREQVLHPVAGVRDFRCPR